MKLPLQNLCWGIVCTANFQWSAELAGTESNNEQLNLEVVIETEQFFTQLKEEPNKSKFPATYFPVFSMRERQKMGEQLRNLAKIQKSMCF